MSIVASLIRSPGTSIPTGRLHRQVIHPFPQPELKFHHGRPVGRVVFVDGLFTGRYLLLQLRNVRDIVQGLGHTIRINTSHGSQSFPQVLFGLFAKVGQDATITIDGFVDEGFLQPADVVF